MFSTLKGAMLICATLIILSAALVKATVPAQPQESKPVIVKMTDKHKFIPEEVTIKVGETVQWDNDEEGGVHQVTTDPDVAVDPSDVSTPAGTQPFDSHFIKSGQSFKHQFTVPGVYRYACPPHEVGGMIGQVTVTK